jgi:hypothetical protein
MVRGSFGPRNRENPQPGPRLGSGTLIYVRRVPSLRSYGLPRSRSHASWINAPGNRHQYWR